MAILSRRPRVLYLMHVDWRWIRQRPHVFAEELATTSDVLVMHRLNPKRASLPKNRSAIRRLPFVPVRSSWGRRAIRLDAAIQRRWLQIVCSRFRPDVMWITHPSLYSYLPDSLRDIPVIYDCMDDAEAMARDPRDLQRIRQVEHDLVQRASAVVCSSATLMDKIASWPGVRERVSLVRNALSAEWIGGVSAPATGANSAPRRLTVAYVGTVATWIDFDLLVTCLEQLPKLEIHLVGPVSEVRPPSHPRLLVKGPVEHRQLRRHMAAFDGFLLPFRIDSTTSAVDPVKLYEYLSCEREVVASWYPEISRFEPYIHFYRTVEEAASLLEQLGEGSLERKAELSRDFLSKNTWEERGKEIRGVVSHVLAGKGHAARGSGERS